MSAVTAAKLLESLLEDMRNYVLAPVLVATIANYPPIVKTFLFQPTETPNPDFWSGFPFPVLSPSPGLEPAPRKKILGQVPFPALLPSPGLEPVPF